MKRKALERLEALIDPDRVLRTAAEIAYSDITQLVDAKGQIRRVSHWPADIKKAVASVKAMKRNVEAGDGKQEEVVELHLAGMGGLSFASRFASRRALLHQLHEPFPDHSRGEST